MNIIILHPHLSYPGGASKYMLEVARRLVLKKMKVTVVTTRYEKSLVAKYKGIDFVEIGKYTTGELFFWLTLPVFLFKLKKVLDKFEDKILFPQIFPPIWWAAIYKYFSPRTKVFWMCQEPSAFIHSPLVIRSLKQPGRIIALFLRPILSFIDLQLVRKMDYVIANSKYGQRLIKEIYQRESDIFAYPSVNPLRYRPLKKKQNYIFTVSRLDKQKNIDLLIKAFVLLPPKILVRFSLFIGGEGTERQNLEVLAENLSVKEKVHFLGRISEEMLPKFYAEAKIAIFLGENEPFGIIPVEAMSCGTPVVALNGGGVVESVIDGETGILLSEKDDQKLAKAISLLLNNKPKLKLMSQNARKHVLQNFSWDKTANKIYSFIRKEI